MSSLAENRVLSGIQPSGKLHIGNYFGAIQQHIELQDSFPGQTFIFIANLHALTTVQNGDQLRENTLDLALDYLALGLDTQKTTFFKQSDIHEICELAWLLATVTPVSLLEKGVSYKDKVGRGLPASTGLLTYPVLQAADILAYDATVVPVGEDQVQHIEFTRDMAGFFNNAYGGGEPLLRLPTARFSAGRKVPGLDGQKMSKSYGNTIGIFDEGETLRKKVMSIKTASVPLGQPLDPDNDTVFAIYRLVSTPAEAEDMANRYRNGDIGFGQAKKELLEKLDVYFAPFRRRRKELLSNLDYVQAVLRLGSMRAREVASQTLARCRKAAGLT